MAFKPYCHKICQHRFESYGKGAKVCHKSLQHGG